jgi:hypothetical protein
MKILTILMILLTICALSMFWSHSVVQRDAVKSKSEKANAEKKEADIIHVLEPHPETMLGITKLPIQTTLPIQTLPSKAVVSTAPPSLCIPDKQALVYKSPHMVKPPESERIFVCCATTKGDMTIGDNMQ